MDEIEGLNEKEFATLISNIETLGLFMESESNRAMLTPEQAEEAQAILEN
jgi:hypothetical protein